MLPTIRYPLSPFTPLLVLLLVCKIIGVIVDWPWRGTTPSHCLVHVVELLYDWKEKKNNCVCLEKKNWEIFQ